MAFPTPGIIDKTLVNCFYTEYEAFIGHYQANDPVPETNPPETFNPNNYPFDFNTVNIKEPKGDYKGFATIEISDEGALSVPPKVHLYSVVIELKAVVTEGIGQEPPESMLDILLAWLMYRKVIRNDIAIIKDDAHENGLYHLRYRLAWSYEAVKPK